MLYLRLILTADELLDLMKDTTYSKLEVEPKGMKNFRDYKVKAFLPIHIEEFNGVKALIKAQLYKPYLREVTKDLLLEVYNRMHHSQWISVADMKLLRNIEAQHNIYFSIPRKYNIYLNESKEAS